VTANDLEQFEYSIKITALQKGGKVSFLMTENIARNLQDFADSNRGTSTLSPLNLSVSLLWSFPSFGSRLDTSWDPVRDWDWTVDTSSQLPLVAHATLLKRVWHFQLFIYVPVSCTAFPWIGQEVLRFSNVWWPCPADWTEGWRWRVDAWAEATFSTTAIVHQHHHQYYYKRVWL